MKVEEIKLALERNVQFALADDLKSSVSVLQNENSLLQKSMSEADKYLVKVRTDWATAAKIQQSQGKITTLAENKAKELGVLATSIPSYNEALKAYSNLDATLQKAGDY